MSGAERDRQAEKCYRLTNGLAEKLVSPRESQTTRKRLAAFSAKKKPIHRVFALLDVGIRERLQEVPECDCVRAWHLDPDQDAAIVRALVPIVKKADVPSWVHRRQEAHQRTGSLGEYEAE